MSDLPPPLPESTGQPEQSDLPQAVQPIDELGNPSEISEFKEAPFLNGLFVTLIVALILSEISFVVATILKIHASDLYYSEFSKISITDPNHQHARSELATLSTISGIISAGCLFLLILSGVCMLFWMFRNYKNSIALAESRLKYSAGEATAGLVIPFVSFYRPYLAVVDMVKIAKDRLNWDSLETPVYVQLWWLFNIAAIAVSLITRIIAMPTPDALRTYVWDYAWVLVYIFSIFKHLLLVRIILVIWEGAHQLDQVRPVSNPELRRID
jgi:hypothetical protein